jgi:hypothetical protein
MKAYRGGGAAPPFLISALYRGKWSASRPGRFNPEERAPGYRWVGPRAGLEAIAKIKSISLAGSRTPVVQPVA